jgi:glycosyltransferase involved in cell wall biosynthesis
MTIFSVIIATRNRPQLFKEALSSVLAQSCDSFEIIVIDDGSDHKHADHYRKIIGESAKAVRFHSLSQRPQGHGAAYARNSGAARATGEYLCFLDDDDSWTDEAYLAQVRTRCCAGRTSPDLHLSNQAAFLQGERKPGPLWLDSLTERLVRAGRRPSSEGAYQVSIGDLLATNQFCHLNTLIVRRSLFDEVGGMDERLGWEEDRDLYLRLLDRAKSILYAPDCVARHNIPDPAKTANLSTAIPEMERRLFQLRVFDKAILFANNSLIRSHAKQQKAYTLKRITETFVAQKNYSLAGYWARLAFAAGPTFKWAGFTGWLALRAVNGRFRRSNGQTRPAAEPSASEPNFNV